MRSSSNSSGFIIATLALACCWLNLSAFGQGTLRFDTHIPGVVDTRITIGGELLESNFGAQLFTPSPGNTLPLIPLFPATTFKSGAEAGYVNPVTVLVPGSPAGSSVNIIIGVFHVRNPNVLCGNFGLFPVTLGTEAQPGYLTDLPPFLNIVGDSCIPEPPALVLACLGALIFLSWRTLRPRTRPSH